MMMTLPTIYWSTYLCAHLHLFTPYSNPIKPVILSFPFYSWGNWGLRRLSKILKVKMAEPTSKPICPHLWGCAWDLRWSTPRIYARLAMSLGKTIYTTHLEGLCHTPQWYCSCAFFHWPGPVFSVVPSLSVFWTCPQLDTFEVSKYDISLGFFFNVVTILLGWNSFSFFSFVSMTSWSNPKSFQPLPWVSF